MEIGLGNGFYVDNSKPVSNQICRNLYPVYPQTKNAFSPAYLAMFPGLSLFATTTEAGCRGQALFDEELYVVTGPKLYRIGISGSVTDLGTIAGTGLVSIAISKTQMCIVVPAVKGYVFSKSPDTLVEITDTEYTSNPSLGVTFKDGYFVHFVKTKIFHSAINDATDYPANAEADAEVDPDGNTAIFTSRNQLIVGGVTTIEVFQNVGTSPFAFQRIEGAVQQTGIASNYSLTNFDNSFVLVGAAQDQGQSVWRYTGSSIVKLSTDAIDAVMESLTPDDVSEIRTSTNSSNGHFFLNVHLPSRTFTYDATSSALAGYSIWSERRSTSRAAIFGGAAGVLVNWEVFGITKAYGKFYATNRVSGEIAEIRSDVYQEYGVNINWAFSTMPVFDSGKPLIIKDLELFCETGVGEMTGDTNPLIGMSYSDDGGRTFNSPKYKQMGETGHYKQRLRWRRLGRAPYTRMFMFSGANNVKTNITKLILNGAPGIR